MLRRGGTFWIASAALLLAACGGEDSPSSNGGATGGGTTPPPPPPAGNVYSVPPATSLSSADVGTIIAQAAAEARSRNLGATIAVTDRVGNVLGVFAMPGAAATARIPAAPDGTSRDAQGLTIPAAGAAIAKAIT
ncbi:MAG TPA: hypothetical protein VK913_08235, partial [Erythrobacter sp.]|nr:hypothetical protein [Erythrobacter sp.]